MGPPFSKKIRSPGDLNFEHLSEVKNQFLEWKKLGAIFNEIIRTTSHIFSLIIVKFLIFFLYSMIMVRIFQELVYYVACIPLKGIKLNVKGYFQFQFYIFIPLNVTYDLYNVKSFKRGCN